MSVLMSDGTVYCRNLSLLQPLQRVHGIELLRTLSNVTLIKGRYHRAAYIE
jgi:hypothetical protein